jgi:hypothetical protein
MSDIELAREAAAQAQANPTVQKMIRSGDFDAWPNVQGAINAIRLARSGLAHPHIRREWCKPVENSYREMRGPHRP